MISYDIGFSLVCVIILTDCGINGATACVADDSTVITTVTTCKANFAEQPNKKKCVGKFTICVW